VIISKWDQWSR